ncbi:hypothetical protein M569_03919 [Genlisea aurea]|uniref:Uncharacterized protein n=1 Tax=Genlisea aurea TaxID=192259 RepID=S8D0M2_9LAMI|nr:hypothetical protein M569_03919 [Genlisea aurea]
MEKVGVVMTSAMCGYLERELAERFALFKLWESPSESRFLALHGDEIKAAVVDPNLAADSDLIHSLPHLEIVATYSVGFDNIDLNRCRERGIRVTNTPDVLADDVADVAIGLAIAVLRKICRCDGFVRSGSWRRSGGEEFELTSRFSGKSIGIIGLGRIGSAIAKRAQAFGCKINYHSRNQKPNSSSNYTYFSSVLDLASNSQILIVSCSLTDQTRRIVGRRVIDALGPEGVLVNVGRGAHVDEAELVSALREGRLGGAGLDVYEDEPRVRESFLGMKNVVLLPHVGSDTVETSRDMADLVVANLELHFLKKQPLLTPVI